MLEKNSIMLLNDMIYKIYNMKDFDQMRLLLLKTLRFLIPFDTAAFFLASKDVPYTLCDPVALDAPKHSLEDYMIEYQDLDYTRWTFAASASRAYRETDLLGDTLRENHPYYQAMFTTMNVHYSMLLTVIHQGTFLGVINLFRKKQAGDFTDEELFLFELLKDHLSTRCSAELNRSHSPDNDLPTKKELIETYHLTLREIEVVNLLLQGISRDKICETLCISPNTLKKHIVNIYKKLNINSWRELFQLLKK